MTPPRLRRSAHLALRRLAAAKAKAGLHPPIRDSVEEWAAERQAAPSQLIFPPRGYERTLPRTVEPDITTNVRYTERQSMSLRGRYLVPVQGAKLVGRSGLVCLPDGSFAAESVFGRSQVEQDVAYYAPRRRPVVAKRGNYFSLIVKWEIESNGNYYHWIHDTLLRLYGVISVLPADTRFIVPASLRPFQLETLRLVGITEDQLVSFSGEEDWELETLHFAPATTNSGSDRVEADVWLRDAFLDGLGIVPRPADRRLYISRRLAPTRRLVNEDAIEAELERYGFETCLPETLSLREQVELFSQAEIVVATHGAALTNLMFSPPGMTVVEMIPSNKALMAYVYWAMADALGQQYWYFDADTVPRDGYEDDTHVPLEKLTATLDRLALDPTA